MVRLADAPVVETHLVDSTRPPGGVGEIGTPPLAPALANALFVLTGQTLARAAAAAVAARGSRRATLRATGLLASPTPSSGRERAGPVRAARFALRRGRSDAACGGELAACRFGGGRAASA